MTKPIKIAGINCQWTEHYAKIYKEKLCDVGFEAKIMYLNGIYYVAYSYRVFTTEELSQIVKEIFGE